VIINTSLCLISGPLLRGWAFYLVNQEQKDYFYLLFRVSAHLLSVLVEEDKKKKKKPRLTLV
jgi:hypothetical protein